VLGWVAVLATIAIVSILMGIDEWRALLIRLLLGGLSGLAFARFLEKEYD
jgi:multisubunit Na+/H+ antiporter MnhF subunit